MGKPPAFKFYAADFAMDTRRMTAEQVGAYIRLLCDAWVNGSLPTDPEALSLIAGVPHRRFTASVWPGVEGCWRSDGNGGYINPRLEVERGKQREWSRKSAKGGRAGSQAKAKQ